MYMNGKQPELARLARHRGESMYLLEPREKPSQLMRWLSPLIALIAMLVVGSLLFFILGVDPAKALYIFFIEPLTSVYSLSELGD